MPLQSFRSLCLIIVLVLATCGCRKDNASSKTEAETPLPANHLNSLNAGVATINVTEIARVSGKLREINVQLDQREKEFNLILDGLRKIHLQELKELEETFESVSTEQDKKAIADLKSQQAGTYNRRWQETRLQLTSLKQKLDEQFLAVLQPIAKEVAAKKGLSVVIRQENVFCATNQFDITSAVSKRYVESFPVSPSSLPPEQVAEMPSRDSVFEPRK